LLIEDIAVGGLIELEVKCDGKTMSFKSDVVLVNNNSVLIKSITVDDRTIGFSDKYQVNFLYKFEGILFIWESVTVKLVKYDGGVYHKIDMSGEGKPYNRRNSFRMYIGLDMPVYVNTSAGPTAVSVLVKDISETGVAFISKDEYEVSRTFRLKLTDDNNVINLSGVIVRKEFLNHLGSFIYGCKFTEKNLKLAKYIIKKQTDALKKKSEPALMSKDKALTKGKRPQPAGKKKNIAYKK